MVLIKKGYNKRFVYINHLTSSCTKIRFVSGNLPSYIELLGTMATPIKSSKRFIVDNKDKITKNKKKISHIKLLGCLHVSCVHLCQDINSCSQNDKILWKYFLLLTHFPLPSSSCLKKIKETPHTHSIKLLTTSFFNNKK